MGSVSGVGAAGRTRLGVPPATVAVWIIGALAIVTAALLLSYGGDRLEDAGQVTVAFAMGGLQLVLGAILTRTAPGDVTAALIASLGLIVVPTLSVRGDALGVFAGAWMLLYLPLALVLIVVPTGHPATRRWAIAGRVLCGVVAAFLLGCAALATWPQASGALEPTGFVLLAAFLVLLIACAAAPFVRYRRADELGRIRLRWVLVAGLSLPFTLLLCWTSYLTIGAPDLVGIGLLVMFLAIPAGATIALSRPQLFDVDRATVSVVTALSLVVVALAGLTVASLAVGTPMDGWHPIAAATTAAAVTLAAVLAFPLVRRGFDRMLYPERARAVARLRRLWARVDAGVERPEAVQEVLRDALRDPGLVVAYRRLADRAMVGMDGLPVAGSERTAPVRARGEEIGGIVPSPGHVKRPATAIARATAPLLDAVRARSELAKAAAEVEASRERLLRAGYDERRRLERDLHDGAQQRLVALGMQLRVLQRTAAPGAELSASLDAAVAQLGTAVAELRQLARGVRPSALDDGLSAALAELERLSPDTVELDVRAGVLPDAVATTAYFVVGEAVANALRHAEASRIRVIVRDESGTLLIKVSDDGRGGAVMRATGGLTGLADRVHALGGRITVSSSAEAGTVVEAMLPCVS